ncbi:MAG: SIMPL domain-containing protein [Verrucomicrobiota bacterium JB024]|nr:SIMPL domain-containing protein [Verrucomicrobiota bacterium JB024]
MKTLLTLIFCLPLALAAQTYTVYADKACTGNISVTGEATVYVVPDIIKVNFGIETKDMELAASQAKNRAILRKALEAFHRLGIEDSDIKTDVLSVEPRYESGRYEANRGENVFLGYYSRTGFVVTLKDKALLERVVDAGLAVGVNYVHGVEFQTSELRKYRDQAREMAVTAAREKADAMTATLGVRLGPPTSINENGGGNWFYAGGSGWGGAGRRSYDSPTQNSLFDADGSQSAGEIQLGKIAVTASVGVTFRTVAVPEAAR